MKWLHPGAGRRKGTRIHLGAGVDGMGTVGEEAGVAARFGLGRWDGGWKFTEMGSVREKQILGAIKQQDPHFRPLHLSC